MNLLRKIKSKPYLIIFVLFLLIHLVLLNVNKVEWGDSYRILRASEYIRDFSYPSDEKRAPLYSFFLALRPFENLDPVIWGKIFMLITSFLSFCVFWLISKKIFEKKRVPIIISLLFFAFNPVYFYWSLRIYADVFFSLIVLLSVYLYIEWKDKLDVSRLIFLALISFLSILTRFEGYLMALSLGLALLVENCPLAKCNFSEDNERSNKECFFKKFFSRLRIPFIYGISLIIFLLPYWFWRNPLSSTYFEEPERRTYDLLVLIRYFLSLIFLFGFTSAFPFLLAFYRETLSFFKDYTYITIFVFLELILILGWPAAIPRLFIPLIPLLILPISKTIFIYFDKDRITHNPNDNFILSLICFVFLVVYIMGQRFANLQFLIPSFKFVLVIGLVNLLSVAFIYKKRLGLFIFTITTSMLLWIAALIYIHKDIYSTIRLGINYSLDNNLKGVIALNDNGQMSAFDWYLNQNPNAPSDIKGVYFPYVKSAQLSENNLKDKGYDYLLFTNELDPPLKVDFEKREYLKVLKTFKREINGKIFFAKVVKVEN